MSCAPEQAEPVTAPITTFDAVIEYRVEYDGISPPDQIKYTRGPFITLERCQAGLLNMQVNAKLDGGVISKAVCE